MRFIVLGAGAIGCYVGARLALAGNRVCFVGRPHTLEPLAVSGLQVSAADGFDGLLPQGSIQLAGSLAAALHTFATPDHQAKNPEPVLVLVCVKTTATLAAGQEIAQCCPAGTLVLSLQNGVDNARHLADAAPQVKVLAGMVPFTVNWKTRNHVARANDGILVVQRDSASLAFQPVFQSAGLPMTLSADMTAVLWGKLLLNLINPVNALANKALREQLLRRDDRRVLALLMDEALGVLKRAGIRPAKVGAAAAPVIPTVLRLPNWLFIRVAAGMLRMDPSARTSMCADLQNGKPTEIDALCGAVVRLAQAHGTRAPMNQKMCQLIQDYRPGQVRSGQGMLQALR